MLKRNLAIKWYYFFCFFIPIVCISNVTFVLDGADPELEENIRKQLSNIDCDITNINFDFQKRLYNTIKSGLKPIGYYNPTIEIITDLNHTTGTNDHELIVKINPGEPTKIIGINVRIFGDGQYDRDYQQIIEGSKFFIGKILNHNDYEYFKNRIYNLSISKGYFDAKFQKSQLVVIPSLSQSIWNIDLNSGNRYLFEEIKFQGNQIKLNYLRNICNIRLGEYYDSQSILELNKRLSSTNWFESILISSDFMGVAQKKN